MAGVIEYINSFHAFGKAPGLHRIEHLLHKLGNPQKDIACIHVAGTNGKGSVCTYISQIFQSAGLKTGLYISPYVIDFRERFQINGEMISETALTSYIERIKPVLDTISDEDKPTQFDLITAIAFLYFKENGCDAVVLETGLGGLYDSTNIIENPLCTVITSISNDHTAILGDTIEKIALQKAGILKKNNPAVLYPLQEPSAMRVVQQKATDTNSQLTIPDMQQLTVEDMGLSGSRVHYKGLAFSLKLCGAFQPLNAITAIEAVKACGLPIKDKDIITGLEKTIFPARCEVISAEPPILLDGAHNPDGLRALADFIKQHLPRPITAVMGMMADKDISSALKEIAPCFDEIFCVEPNNPRSLTAKGLAELGSRYTNCTPFDTLKEALTAATSKNASVVVCGSLYLATEARPILKGGIK